MTSAIIIGGGLFGSIIARHLKSRGVYTITIDDKREGSGSRPAACLMKPSWFSSLGSEYYTPALDTLDELYGLQDIQFGIVKVKWIPPKKILIEPDVLGEVTGIQQHGKEWLVKVNNQVLCFTAEHLIVAAGIWSNDILKKISGGGRVVDLSTRQGIAFITPHYEVPKPFIHPWAPYKQIVAFNREPGKGWISDGTAVKELTTTRKAMSLERCRKALGDPQTRLEGVMGNRPYTPQAKPCYLQSHGNNLWVVTGGAKNGTIAAGWAAHKLGELVK